MAIGLLINHSVRNIFLQKISSRKCDRETSSRSFLKKAFFKVKASSPQNVDLINFGRTQLEHSN